jgi:cytochrome c-type biogenesis protein CcmF
VGTAGEQTAEINIRFNPLVFWVWLGGAVMAIGGLIVLWPQAERRRAHGGYAAVLEPAETAPAGAGA